jgi:NADH dehydrogenase
MRTVVILGAGFGGVSCALELTKQRLTDVQIILINDHEYHVFNPALYQAATNEQPSRNVAIPLSTIFENKRVIIKIGRVEKIDASQNQVILKRGEIIAYDYLVLAVGSQTEDYGIPGVKENSYTLKTLYDAAILRNQVKLLFENACNDKACTYPIRVTIGGGGFTGTELAGELHKYCDKLVKQFMMPETCFEVTIIQSGSQLLNGLDNETAQKAKDRLEKLHVKVVLGSHITRVDKNLLVLENSNTLPFSLLVWTVGIRANKLLQDSGFEVDKTGKVVVNELLQLPTYENILAIGDCASFAIDSEKHSAPTVAPVAIDQGKIAAINLQCLLNNQPLTLHRYKYHHYGYIIPISGKFALARLDFFKADGFLGFLAEQAAVFHYFLSILPLSKALKRWNNFEMELTNED